MNKSNRPKNSVVKALIDDLQELREGVKANSNNIVAPVAVFIDM